MWVNLRLTPKVKVINASHNTHMLIQPVDRKTFEERTFPHVYDVLVNKENDHYYAKDAYGKIICVDSQTACLQESINYIKDSGGKVFIKSNLVLDEEVDVSDANNVEIVGNGSATIYANNDINIFSVPGWFSGLIGKTPVNGFVVRDLIFDMRGFRGSPISLAGSRIVVDNVETRNVNGYSVYLINAKKVFITNSRLHSIGIDPAIGIESFSNDYVKDILILNNYIEAEQFAGIATSLADPNTYMSDIIVIGNKIVGAKNRNGIELIYAPNSVVIGNIIEEVGQHGIVVTSNSIVESNIIKSCGMHAIFLIDGTSGTIVHGNMIPAGKSIRVNVDDIPNNIILNNMNYPTDIFVYTNQIVPIGTNNTYGSSVTIVSPSGIIRYPRIQIIWGGIFDAGETVSVKITAVYNDNTTASIIKSATATDSLWLADSDIMQLMAQGKIIKQINISASTNLPTTQVTVTINAYGF
jgi:hypothetical protein